MARVSRQERLDALTKTDCVYWSQSGALLAGMDEVGRGPLAGPVAACCAVMPPQPLVLGVDDSKKLSEKRREALFDPLTRTALAYAVAFVEPAVIDEINILEATRLAFTRAFAGIGLPVTDVLIDALTGLSLPTKQHVLVHGDALSYSIAAASVIAKVARDRYMLEQDALYPQYGFAQNKGYGTAAHIAALRAHGPCPIHRASFIGKFL